MPPSLPIPLARLTSLLRLQCSIFSTAFNPSGTRTGGKILRQRLRGPAMAAYYPRRIATVKTLADAYPEMEIYDEFEEERLEHVQITRSRGKGPPKKKRVKDVGKKKKK